MATAANRPDQGAAGGPPPPGPPTETQDPALAKLARAIAPGSLDEIGFAIPWHHRLSTKLLVMTGAVAVATIAAFFFAEIAVQRHLLTQVVAESDLLSHTIRNALHRAMLQDRRGDAYLIMQDIGRQPGIEMVRMMDGDGRITFSTDRDEIGHSVDRKAEACSACHAEGEPLHRLDLADRSRVFPNGKHRILGIVTPLYNEETCSNAACHAHPPERKVLGVIDVGVSLARLDSETAGFRVSTLVSATLAAALLGVLLWLFTRHHVMRPVAALVQATRRVARDQLELEVPVTWSGELGILAASFNEMTRSLRVTKRELDTLMHGLEKQVEDRTAALRNAQEQLVRTEKLTSLGKLSASIAHEINNPLAGILTFAKLTVRTLDQGPPDDATRRTVVKHLHLVERETERCSAIVRNLLDFARERPLALKDTNVVAVIDEAMQLLGNQIQIQGVALEKQLAAGAARGRRLRPAPAGVRERHHERLRGDVPRRQARDRDGPRRERPLGRARVPGLRARHPSRSPLQDLRSVLHHEGEGDRARALGRVRHRRAARRQDRAEDRAGEGDPGHAAASASKGGGGEVSGRSDAADLRLVDR